MSERERRFVLAYMGEACGNATKAAESAGYKGGPGLAVTASRLLRKANIASEIANQQITHTAEAIANREERFRFLTSVLRDETAHPLARLKACHQLAKASGDYIERHDHSGEIILTWQQ